MKHMTQKIEKNQIHGVEKKKRKNACHKNRGKLNTWHTTETEKNQIHGITRNREKFNT